MIMQTIHLTLPGKLLILFCLLGIQFVHSILILNEFLYFSLMMITTQKLTSFAFAYYDGMRPVEKLTEDQKSQAIR
jgi:hypothetical protein